MVGKNNNCEKNEEKKLCKFIKSINYMRVQCVTKNISGLKSYQKLVECTLWLMNCWVSDGTDVENKPENHWLIILKIHQKL